MQCSNLLVFSRCWDSECNCGNLFNKLGGDVLCYSSASVFCCVAESYMLHPEVYLIYYSLIFICLGGISFELSIYIVLLVFTFMSELHMFSCEAYVTYYVLIGLLLIDKAVKGYGTTWGFDSFIGSVEVYFYTVLLIFTFASHFYTFSFEAYVIYYTVVGFLLIGEVINNRGDFLGGGPPDCWLSVGLIFALALLCCILFMVVFLLVNRSNTIYGASWARSNNTPGRLYRLLPIAMGCWGVGVYNYLKPFESLGSQSVVYASFNVSMLLVVVSGGAFIFLIGWEVMGLCSVVLVSTHCGRLISLYSASQAWLQNRLSDLSLIVGSVCSSSWMLLAAFACNSSMWLCVSWLANAMEGPTSVSTLLHSSTMVLAGLILWVYTGAGLLGGVAVLLGCVVLCAFVSMANPCFKRNIANSTSSQLHFMSGVVYFISWLLGALYMVCHSAAKSSSFMIASSMIHYTGSIKSSESLSQSKLTSLGSLGLLVCLGGLLSVGLASVANDAILLLGSMNLSVLLLISGLMTPVYLKEMVPLSDSGFTLSSTVGAFVLLAGVYYFSQLWSSVWFAV